MLENIRRRDICIFSNGEEAVVKDLKPGHCGFNTIRLYFNKPVEGASVYENAWNYYLSGKWIGDGNDIVKVINQ